MAPIEIAILVVLVGLVLFSVYFAVFTSWYVAKSDYFSPSQKKSQYAIIWFVPLLGAALVLHVLSLEIRHRQPGWVPWFDFLLVATFASSATAAIENTAHAGANQGDISDGGND